MAATTTTAATARDGVAGYYRSKIAELEVRVAEDTQNLRRLEAQLNTKGLCARARTHAHTHAHTHTCTNSHHRRR